MSANGVWEPPTKGVQNPEWVHWTYYLQGFGSTVCPSQKLEGMKPWGPQLGESWEEGITLRPPLFLTSPYTLVLMGPRWWVQPHGSLPWLHYHRLTLIPASKPG